MTSNPSAAGANPAMSAASIEQLASSVQRQHQQAVQVSAEIHSGTGSSASSDSSSDDSESEARRKAARKSQSKIRSQNQVQGDGQSSAKGSTRNITHRLSRPNPVELNIQPMTDGDEERIARQQQANQKKKAKRMTTKLTKSVRKFATSRASSTRESRTDASLMRRPSLAPIDTSAPEPRRRSHNLCTRFFTSFAMLFVSESLDSRYGREFTLGERVADAVSVAVGSWKFVGFQSAFLALWITINALGSLWDPFPFVFLNLILSMQAAYTAPVIMMSQNRQADVDRLKAEDLHEKVDHIRLNQIFSLWDQLTLMNRQIKALSKEVEVISQLVERKLGKPAQQSQPPALSPNQLKRHSTSLQHSQQPSPQHEDQPPNQLQQRTSDASASLHASQALTESASSTQQLLPVQSTERADDSTFAPIQGTPLIPALTPLPPLHQVDSNAQLSSLDEERIHVVEQTEPSELQSEQLDNDDEMQSQSSRDHQRAPSDDRALDHDMTPQALASLLNPRLAPIRAISRSGLHDASSKSGSGSGSEHTAGNLVAQLMPASSQARTSSRNATPAAPPNQASPNSRPA